MRPLNRSITIVCVLFFVLLCLALSLVTYRLFTTSMFDRYQKQLTSILDYVEQYIDHDDMAECARTLEESDTYREFQAFFDNFVDHYTDLHYLYLFQVLPPEEEVQIREVCAANTTYEKENEPENVLRLGDGEADWYDSETIQRFREIQEGDEDVFFLNPSEWGVDYTLTRPLVNSAGEHYGLLCVDVSVDELNESIYRNIYINIGLIVALAVLFILLLLWWLRVNVTRPLKQLEKSVTDFASTSTGRHDPDELIFTPPEIRTRNEVYALSAAVTKLSENMRSYVKGMMAAEAEKQGLQAHMSQMNVIAYQDPLTHVKNKAAYDRKVQSLNWDILNRIAAFAIVMVDLNYLKEINDRFGHEHGNEYLTGTCELICNVFSHSPVYRVGGDEFVVVVQGKDYPNREALAEELRRRIDESTRREDASPWHQYSAAVGISDYAPGDDVQTVFSRADQAMYQEKARMKSKS